MQNNKKKLFIITFIVVVLIILGIVLFGGKKNQTNTGGEVTGQDFNPFGTGGTTTQTQNETNGGSNINWTNSISGNNSKFYQITDFAVSGAAFFEDEQKTAYDTETKTVPTLRYVEKSTGHIYQIDLEDNQVSKISNSTIPSVYESPIGNNAETFIYRYVSNDNNSITSFKATLGEQKGEFLPSNITDLSFSLNTDKVFYLVENSSGVIGFIKSLLDNKTSQVFSSPYTEWLTQYIDDQKVYLTTKPSWTFEGSAFSLDIKTGVLNKLLGGIAGLTTLVNNDGSNILYGMSLDTGPKLWLFNIKDHTSQNLNTYGLPEKCVWSKDNISVYCAVPNTIVGVQYPDSWYQGLTSFDDYFVRIETTTGQKYTLANSANEIPVDATKMFLDKEEGKIFFINKKDSTLWSLDI